MSETLEAVGGFPSLAAYFAAHAPEKVPWWFTKLHKDLIPGDPPSDKSPTLEDAENIIGRELSEAEQCDLGSWIDDPCRDLNGELKPFQEAMDKSVAEEERDACEYQKAAFFAWRAFYGEKMATMFGEENSSSMPPEVVKDLKEEAAERSKHLYRTELAP